jgi:hypothetical protein
MIPCLDWLLIGVIYAIRNLLIMRNMDKTVRNWMEVMS